ncbi:MAG: hypothetical protein ACU0CS_04855 [Heliomarina sp.]
MKEGHAIKHVSADNIPDLFAFLFALFSAAKELETKLNVDQICQRVANAAPGFALIPSAENGNFHVRLPVFDKQTRVQRYGLTQNGEIGDVFLITQIDPVPAYQILFHVCGRNKSHDGKKSLVQKGLIKNSAKKYALVMCNLSTNF